MSTTRTCPQCGTVLPAGTLPWLCPKCLLGQAAEPAVAAEPVAVEAPATASVASGPLGGPLPCRLGAYELLERIGQGGMGVVYKARQLSLDRYVAVKVLSLSVLVDKETVHRFRTEAVTAGSLQHPNIVAVHRLRRRYRDLLREQVAQTVHTPADLEEELRSLQAAFSG